MFKQRSVPFYSFLFFFFSHLLWTKIVNLIMEPLKLLLIKILKEARKNFAQGRRKRLNQII